MYRLSCARQTEKRGSDGFLVKERGLCLARRGQHSIALCFPGPYALGMAHLGFQSLVRIVWEIPNFWGDRFFADTGPSSLAFSLSLSTFHVVAFSLSFELDIFSFLFMLKEGGVPLLASERTEEDPFVLVGGPVVTLNPEVVAPFVDCAVIGEGEVVLPAFFLLWSCLRGRGASKQEIKEALLSLPGVYVPEYCTPQYRGNVIKGWEIGRRVTLPVKRQWGDLENFETRTFIYTPSSHFKDTTLVELNRGCRYRCRFCAGSCIYSPLRQRSFPLVLRMLGAVCEWSGKVGLVGSDVLSYPALEEVIGFLRRRGRKLTISSLSGRDLFEREYLLRLLREGGLETVTLAPESGDPSVRLFLGKGLANDDWIELVLECLRRNFRRVKLYFMLGKPRVGVEEDLNFLCRLVKKVQNPSRLFVSYSFLVPKPHTFLEDLETASLDTWKKEKEVFERGLRKMKIPFSGESPRLSWIELVLARGDRKVGLCLLELLESRGFTALPSWRKVLAQLGRDIEDWPRMPWKEGLKPWSVVNVGVWDGGRSLGSDEWWPAGETQESARSHCLSL